jgi:hypothetical protein
MFFQSHGMCSSFKHLHSQWFVESGSYGNPNICWPEHHATAFRMQMLHITPTEKLKNKEDMVN